MLSARCLSAIFFENRFPVFQIMLPLGPSLPSGFNSYVTVALRQGIPPHLRAASRDRHDIVIKPIDDVQP
jgi:hypothetical protein